MLDDLIRRDNFSMRDLQDLLEQIVGYMKELGVEEDFRVSAMFTRITDKTHEDITSAKENIVDLADELKKYRDKLKEIIDAHIAAMERKMERDIEKINKLKQDIAEAGNFALDMSNLDQIDKYITKAKEIAQLPAEEKKIMLQIIKIQCESNSGKRTERR